MNLAVGFRRAVRHFLIGFAVSAFSFNAAACGGGEPPDDGDSVDVEHEASTTPSGLSSTFGSGSYSITGDVTYSASSGKWTGTVMANGPWGSDCVVEVYIKDENGNEHTLGSATGNQVNIVVDAEHSDIDNALDEGDWEICIRVTCDEEIWEVGCDEAG